VSVGKNAPAAPDPFASDPGSNKPVPDSAAPPPAVSDPPAPPRKKSRAAAARSSDEPAQDRLARPSADEGQAGGTRPHVELHTDGACSGNPGPGGWAYILIHPATGKRRESSGGEPDTTNNRMELRAVIEGLDALSRPSTVDLYSDSKYVLQGLSEWMDNWKKKGWRTADRKPVKNKDLWEILDERKGTHQIRFHWIKGHADHPENERCDRLAVEARERIAAGL
jgi:ribonuclease HI